MKCKYPWKQMEIGDCFDVKCGMEQINRYRVMNSISSNRVHAQRVTGWSFAAFVVGDKIRVMRVQQRRSPGASWNHPLPVTGKHLGQFNPKLQQVERSQIHSQPIIAVREPKEAIAMRIAELIAQKKPQEAVRVYQRFMEAR